MFEVHWFKDGSFVIRNKITGIYLSKDGEVLVFESLSEANAHVRKITRELQKTIDRLTNSL